MNNKHTSCPSRFCTAQKYSPNKNISISYFYYYPATAQILGHYISARYVTRMSNVQAHHACALPVSSGSKFFAVVWPAIHSKGGAIGAALTAVQAWPHHLSHLPSINCLPHHLHPTQAQIRIRTEENFGLLTPTESSAPTTSFCKYSRDQKVLIACIQETKLTEPRPCQGFPIMLLYARRDHRDVQVA